MLKKLEPDMIYKKIKDKSTEDVNIFDKKAE